MEDAVSRRHEEEVRDGRKTRRASNFRLDLTPALFSPGPLQDARLSDAEAASSGRGGAAGGEEQPAQHHASSASAPAAEVEAEGERGQSRGRALGASGAATVMPAGTGGGEVELQSVDLGSAAAATGPQLQGWGARVGGVRSGPV